MSQPPQDSNSERLDSIDFPFLAEQTFDDTDLQRELLTLFIAQARRIIPALSSMGQSQQADAGHLLKGSARGIGAWTFANLADAYERANSVRRDTIIGDLATSLTRIETAFGERFKAAS